MSKLACVFIAVFAFACDDDIDGLDENFDESLDESDEIVEDGEVGDIISVSPATLEWRATLVDIDPSTNLVGDAVVFQTEGDQAFDAAVTIRNDSATCARPWHVHFGTCATGGAIVGDPASYDLLVIASDGTAASDVTVRTALDPTQAYHVNIHYSESQIDRIIACGDLVLQ
jgi:hypothetical protein